MVREKISKGEAKETINEFFLNIKNKTPKEILKIKKLSMNKKIPLGNKKRLFCSSCLQSYSGKEKIRIKKGFKIIECANCGRVKRIKL